MLAHLDQLLSDGWTLHLTTNVPEKCEPGAILPYRLAKGLVQVTATKRRCKPVIGTGSDTYQALVSLLKGIE